MKEHSDFQINLWIQNRIFDLIKDREEYDKDSKEINKRNFIREEIISNLELLNDIEDILWFIKNNELLMAQDFIYSDMNEKLRNVWSFIASNIEKFKNWWLYANYFAVYIWSINDKSISFLGDFRKNYTKKLSDNWINVSKESFYLRIQKDIFDVISQINKDFENKILMEKEEFLGLSETETEIWMNNSNLALIFELIDELETNKKLILWDIKKWDFSYAFEYIQEFLDVNSDNIQILMKESIYYNHFLKIMLLIANDWKETVEEIENYFWNELSENMPDKVIVNKGYYDEMKAELYDLVKNLNILLQTWRNN